MDRIEISEKKIMELFGKVTVSAFETDPDLQEMMERFIFGEVYFHGKLTDKVRKLVTLVVLTTNQSLEQLKAQVGAALNIGV
jgi:4-carboxymuconolactone decarboxylase